MKKTIKITIANRCRVSFSKGAINFTNRNGIRRIFSIPHSMLEGRKISEIKVTDTYSEMATEYEITPWIFGKIKDKLESMKDSDVIIPKT